MKVTGAKELLQPQNPFVLGKYPDRPAPAHVLNGFVVAALGSSRRGAEVRDFIGGNAEISSFPFLQADDWQQDRRLEAFRSDLGLILNPDRRAWEKVGSLLPIRVNLATRDPSDDGLGNLMWDLFAACGPRSAKQNVRKFFEPEVTDDPITACATILIDGAPDPEIQGSDPRSSAWFGEDGTLAGQLLAKNISLFVNQLLDCGSQSRSTKIQHIGRGVYFGALLALLLGPTAGSLEDRVESVEEIAPLVVWGDVPPGQTNHPMVTACARSYRNVVERSRQGMAHSLAVALASQPLPTRMPAGQRGRTRLRSQVIDGGAREARSDALVDSLLSGSGLEPPGRSPDESWCLDFIDAAYPPDQMASGLRSMGRKVGFVGPDRGAGLPRFLMETPLLGTLVVGLVPPGQALSFASFIDLCRSQLGLVLGPGSDSGTAARLGLWEGAGIGGRLLQENQELLRRRLIRAGLATEYSDSHTEVLNDAS